MSPIFGRDKKKVRLHGLMPYKARCLRCDRESYGELYSITTWFTIAEKPVFPYSVRYLMACPWCHLNRELTRTEFLDFKNRIQSAQCDEH